MKKPSLVELGRQLQQLALSKARGPDWVKQASDVPRQIAEILVQMQANLPQGETSKAFAYGRISPSDDKDPKNSKSIQNQEYEQQQYYERKLAPLGVQWVGFHSDDGVSAFKKPFLLRKNASIINSLAQRGDHILFLRLDRAFRNTRDFANTYRLWEARGINIHFTQEEFDYTTAIGKFVLYIRAGAAELESSCQSERRKGAIASAMANGWSGPGRYPKYGTRKIKCGKRKRVVDCAEDRGIMRQIVRLRELCANCGHANSYATTSKNRCLRCGKKATSFTAISKAILQLYGREVFSRQRSWATSRACWSAFAAEKRLQA